MQSLFEVGVTVVVVGLEGVVMVITACPLVVAVLVDIAEGESD